MAEHRRIAVISGGSSGIGLAAAVECAAAGHQVIATMRNLARRRALAGDIAIGRKGAVRP